MEFKFDSATISLEAITVKRRKSTGRPDYRESFTARSSQEFIDRYLVEARKELEESTDPIFIYIPKTLNDTSECIVKAYNERRRRGIINLGDIESNILKSVEEIRVL